MGARRKLIVVSNRGPVSFDRDADGGRVARRGGGGLVTALRSLVAMHDVTWIASAMTDEDRDVAAEAGGDAIDETARDGSPYRLKLVAHEPTAYDWFYNVVANPTLWFLQHYLWNFAQAPNIDRGLHHAWEEGYVTVNAGFAEAVVAELEAEPGSPVFFHDYHLYLAPRFVRTRMPDAALSHFVHIPGRSPTTGVFCPRRSAARSTTGSWRTTSSAFTPITGGATSSAPARTSSARSATSWTAPPSTTTARFTRPAARSPSTRRSSTSSQAATRFASARTSSPPPDRSASSSGSTGPTRRRTSSAASGRSSGF